MELRDIPGIGEKTVADFTKAGITTVSQLLHTFPRTYRTYTASDTRSLKEGEWVILRGQVSQPVSRHTGRVSTQSAVFKDISGTLTLRWFNMPYLSRRISPASEYLVKGQVTVFNGRLQIVSPQLTAAADEEISDQMVPIYSSRSGIKPWVFRQKISQSLAHIDPLPDPLTDNLISRYSLIPYHRALLTVHNPPSEAELGQAVRRLSFQELYDLQLSSIRTKNSSLKKAYAFNSPGTLVSAFHQSLPFELTGSQHSAIAEIISDLGKPVAMHRLLQGEVGSGKTVVAVSAALFAHESDFRTILMAPTQILATQLYENFKMYCTPLGLTVSPYTAKSKGDLNADILVGTQALLNSRVLDRVGLIIVDEQHRFGVEQREKLAHGHIVPHLLQMTATPIPRSFAQTLFHHLDITRLTDVPKNRMPVKTFLVPEIKRRDSYRFIQEEVVSHKNQAFIVVPLIEAAEENEVNPLKSLKELESTLKTVFPSLKIDVMHGKMKEPEKMEHMSRFKSGETQILVATSMIEVGIDIPEANIIVIEDAERFGLAQLHQLRGRVGRGGKQGYCFLFSGSNTDKARERLSFFIRESNGEKLAEFDLHSRGPGELFGLTQSGFFNLRLGSMYDEKLLFETYEAAISTLEVDKTSDLS